MMATVPHVTYGLGLRKFQADGFLLTRVYVPYRKQLHLLRIRPRRAFSQLNYRIETQLCYVLHNNVNCNSSLPVSHSSITTSEEEAVVLLVTDSHVLPVLCVTNRIQTKTFLSLLQTGRYFFPGSVSALQRAFIGFFLFSLLWPLDDNNNRGSEVKH